MADPTYDINQLFGGMPSGTPPPNAPPPTVLPSGGSTQVNQNDNISGPAPASVKQAQDRAKMNDATTVQYASDQIDPVAADFGRKAFLANTDVEKLAGADRLTAHQVQQANAYKMRAEAPLGADDPSLAGPHGNLTTQGRTAKLEKGIRDLVSPGLQSLYGQGTGGEPLEASMGSLNKSGTVNVTSTDPGPRNDKRRINPGPASNGMDPKSVMQGDQMGLADDPLKKIGTTSDAVQKAAKTLPPAQWAAMLGTLAMDLLDAHGVGRSAYGGVQRQSMAQQRFATGQTIEQKKQMYQNAAQAEISKMVPETQNKIAQIEAEYRASGNKDIYVSKMNQLRNLALINAAQYTALVNNALGSTAAVSPKSLVKGDLQAPGEVR